MEKEVKQDRKTIIWENLQVLVLMLTIAGQALVGASTSHLDGRQRYRLYPQLCLGPSDGRQDKGWGHVRTDRSPNYPSCSWYLLGYEDYVVGLTLAPPPIRMDSVKKRKETKWT